MDIERIAQLLLGGLFGLRVLDGSKPAWARLGYGLVAADALKSGMSPARETPQLGDGGEGSNPLPAPMRFKAQRVRTIQDRVAKVHEQMLTSTKDTSIYTLARKVLVDRGVPENDHKGEAVALFEEVRTRVRYTWDPTDYDAFQTAMRTLQLRTGDCFVKGTLVLRDDHQLVPIETLRVGDRIWGHTRWSEVTATYEKGILPTYRVQLNNGSAVRLTKDHKVWVHKCRKHDKPRCSCRLEERELTRITVGELQPGMVVTQPDRIPFGTGKMDAGRAYIEGLYLSDGWNEGRRFSISGKDGHPKEAQKREVQNICAALGIKTHWLKRSITVKDPEWTQRLKTMGSRAPQKHALSINLDEGGALSLLRGIMADSGKNTSMGSTFTTTSRELFVQARVLLKMAGLTASERYIEDHGGLGRNPIWRLGIRARNDENTQAPKLLRVKEVLRDKVELPCFDITTDDHFVWLPEADWTTSQCDDYVILLGALLRCVGIQVRSRVVQTKGAATWNHIYLMAKVGKAGAVDEWQPLDASVNKGPFWEVPEAWVTKRQDFDVVG